MYRFQPLCILRSAYNRKHGKLSMTVGSLGFLGFFFSKLIRIMLKYRRIECPGGNVNLIFRLF